MSVEKLNNQSYGETLNRRDELQRKLRQDQRDLLSQKKALEDEVRLAQVDNNRKLDHIKGEYENQLAVDQVRFENNIKSEQDKGYEAIREVLRNQKKQLAATRREGEHNLTATKTYYETEVGRNQQKGERDLQKQQFSQQMKMDSTRSMFDENYNAMRDNQTKSAQVLHDEQVSKLTELQNQANQKILTAQVTNETAAQQAVEHYEGIYKNVLDTNNKSLGSLNQNLDSKVREIKHAHTNALNAYTSKQSDPFYQMVNFNLRVVEVDDRYLIAATIPDQEKGKITVSAQGDNYLVLSGNRKNKEKTASDDGHTRTTSSYQTYSEVVPFRMPIDGANIQKEYKGDVMVITVPKRGMTLDDPKSLQKDRRVARAMQREPLPKDLIDAIVRDVAVSKDDRDIKESATLQTSGKSKTLIAQRD